MNKSLQIWRSVACLQLPLTQWLKEPEFVECDMAAILTLMSRKLNALISEAQQSYINNFYKYSSRKVWSSFQILNTYVQWATLQGHIFEIQEISNVLAPWSSLGSPERKYCHSTDPRKRWQIVLLYTWKYWAERNLSHQVVCLLLHKPPAFFSSQHCTASGNDRV